MDVLSLFTNIDHEEGAEACFEELEKSKELKQEHAQAVHRGLHSVLRTWISSILLIKKLYQQTHLCQTTSTGA